MPPRTRTAKASKGSKENAVDQVNNTKPKSGGKEPRDTRKPLADKTNSASDDNGSIVVVKKQTINLNWKADKENQARPRRERRVPKRFAENGGLKKLSITQDLVVENGIKSKPENHLIVTQKPKISPAKPRNTPKSPFKTPDISLNGSLVTDRPKRIHRLPSKFEDHSISPSKFIPVQPCFASTPLSKLNDRKVTKTVPEKKETPKKPVTKEMTPQKRPIYAPPSTIVKDNNAKSERPLRSKRVVSKNVKQITSPVKTPDILKTPAIDKKRITKNFSFKVLEKKGESPKEIAEKLAVYEFTFDPNEEPKPQKKKRKRTLRKKTASKPKTVTFKSNYDANIAKTLENLRKTVKKTNVTHQAPESKTNAKDPVTAPKAQDIVAPAVASTSTAHHDSITDYHTLDPEPLMDCDNINYSPVASPNNSPRPHVKMSAVNETRDLLRTTRAKSLIRPSSHDPLNLREELSFFDDVPVASSSMNLNTPAKDPLASPWRVEFSALPIKWQANTYIKANMTPAVESSFINPNDVQKKHVYTNMVPQHDSLPDIVTNDKELTNWKQPSIIEFLREAAQKSANKKVNKVSLKSTKAKGTPKNVTTPSKINSFDENVTPPNDTDPEPSNSSENNSSKETSLNLTPLKRKAGELPNEIPAKSPRLEKENDQFFGFDDSENQENASPKKDNHRGRSLRPRARAVLKEMNALTGPYRAIIPLAAKTKLPPSSETVNKLFDGMKSGTEAPELAEKQKEVETSTATDRSWHESAEEDNENSVHLFEDIDVVHHLKPARKSYGSKGKKIVTFCQTNIQDTEMQKDEDLSEEEEIENLPFDNPTIKTKKAVSRKKKKAQKLTKKEVEEVEAWAAAFNSMCEDVDEFPLVVE